MAKQTQPKHPLAEVFGFPAGDMSTAANRHRTKRLCPFNNKVPNCTKDKAQDPLGVCSVFHGNEAVITCPIRFRQGWMIADDAADFFFPASAKWTTLTEVRLKDAEGGSAGNIDIVLCAYDKAGKVYDFGALEVQAVYISGNVRNPFAHYMEAPTKNAGMDWTVEENYPRPDYLSSSRKRLAPQLIFKGGIINAWGKKTAVALNKGFFNTLPKLPEVPKAEADIAWLIYDLKPPTTAGAHYELFRERTVYTRFEPALNQITKSSPGKVEDFLRQLQTKVDEKLETPPTNRTLENPFGK
ncbi:MAG: NotI family restriction endonuclease [Verrucomicrobia bacterium]|nr:NotI family restriction endonuclease [Verrucomicrobiota bacterium]